MLVRPAMKRLSFLKAKNGLIKKLKNVSCEYDRFNG